eukprot:scaffold46046_cov48-Phaeocystis_antarctica.AAC.1
MSGDLGAYATRGSNLVRVRARARARVRVRVRVRVIQNPETQLRSATHTFEPRLGQGDWAGGGERAEGGDRARRGPGEQRLIHEQRAIQYVAWGVGHSPRGARHRGE